MLIILCLSVIVLSVLGDPCTEHVDATHGQTGQCIKKSCCQYKYYVSALCAGDDNACCFTSDTCGSGGWSDIGYSFIIGEDGNAYEGRGWDKIGAHTQGYNSVGLGFCMIGTFDTHVPNASALNTLRRLIACGVSKGKIKSSYMLRGHRDMNDTSCPGTALYNLIKTWSNY